jgi:DNA polymerase III epsilon subunit-like protein
MIQSVIHDTLDVMLDIESGGFSTKKNPILEFGWGFLNPAFEIIAGDSICILPQPGMVIEQMAAMINGYTEERWAERGAIELAEAQRQVYQVFEPYQGLTMYGYNVKFDKKWTEVHFPELAAKVKEWRCVMEWYKRYCVANHIEIVQGTLKLESACKTAGYRQVDRHGALEDCFSTAGVSRFLVGAGIPIQDN